MFSVAWQRLHVFPRSASISCLSPRFALPAYFAWSFEYPLESFTFAALEVRVGWGVRGGGEGWGNLLTKVKGSSWDFEKQTYIYMGKT